MNRDCFIPIASVSLLLAVQSSALSAEQKLQTARNAHGVETAAIVDVDVDPVAAGLQGPFDTRVSSCYVTMEDDPQDLGDLYLSTHPVDAPCDWPPPVSIQALPGVVGVDWVPMGYPDGIFGSNDNVGSQTSSLIDARVNPLSTGSIQGAEVNIYGGLDYHHRVIRQTPSATRSAYLKRRFSADFTVSGDSLPSVLYVKSVPVNYIRHADDSHAAMLVRFDFWHVETQTQLGSAVGAFFNESADLHMNQSTTFQVFGNIDSCPVGTLRINGYFYFEVEGAEIGINTRSDLGGPGFPVNQGHADELPRR
jgi:hypothetical protein